MYTNLNSLTSKFNEFELVVNNLNPTIILITETWLNADKLDSLVALPNYTLYRSDRQTKRGGGSCIYVKTEFGSVKITVQQNHMYQTGENDSIWLNVKIGRTEFLIACIYRPPDSSIEKDAIMLNSLQNAAEQNSNLLIFGDFNFPDINWTNPTIGNSNNATTLFMDMYMNCNFTQLIESPTRYRKNDKPSLIDLILVTDPDMISFVQILPPIGISDHVVILATSQIITENSKATTKKPSRNYFKTNYTDVNTFLSTCAFQVSETTNTSSERFSHLLDLAISKYVPLRKFKSSRDKPWITATLKSEINKKRRLWDAYKRTNSPYAQDKYRYHANILRAQLRSARTNYEIRIIDSGSKNFYKYIKRVLKSGTSPVTLRQLNDGALQGDPKIVAEMFAKQFHGAYVRESLENFPSLPDSTRIADSLTSIEFTAEKVYKQLTSLSSHSSPGHNEPSPHFLKSCVETLSKPLACIMKQSMDQSTVPVSWKCATVIPIYKKGDKLLPQNYRPVSLTSILGKCMEKIIANQLREFLVSNSVIPNCQHGFVPKRSVTTNLLNNLDIWSKAFDEGIPVDIVYIDFEKAFDRVPIERLLYKLEHYGVRGNLLRWIEDFLKNRCFRVRIDGELSENYPVLSGVPQGSVLGPILFVLYVSDLSKCLKSNPTFFADDTKLFNFPTTKSDILKTDLKQLELWSSQWLLSLNADKCTILHIGYNNPKLEYMLNGVTLAKVDTQLDLGVTLSSDLKWSAHIVSIVKKANSVLYLVKCAFKDISSELMLNIFKTYIRPLLEYASSVWCPYFVKDIELIEKVQRRATKVPQALKFLSYEERLLKLGITTLKERRDRGDLIETYKVISGYYSCPVNIFTFNQNVQLRGHSFKLVLERCNKLPRKNFLCNRVHKRWNSLPASIVGKPNTNLFKSALDDYFLR